MSRGFHERLSWTPTERIEKHLQMLEFANELRKAGQKHRGQSHVGRAKDLRLLPELEALLELRQSQK